MEGSRSSAIKNAEKLFIELISEKETKQRQIDQFLEKNMKKIGGSIAIATSIAVARAGAASRKQQLFEYLNNGEKYSNPIMLGKCIGGGAHAKKDILFRTRSSQPFVREL